MRIFLDLDGTMARFYEKPGCLENCNKPGFFKNLLPYENMVKAVDMLRSRGDIHVYGLSAVETDAGAEEKEGWLATHLSAGTPMGCFFTKPHESKAEYIRNFYGELTRDDFLLDDYSLRLKEWYAAGGTAIKVLNEHNGRGWNGHNFDGPTISVEWSANEIYKTICEICGLKLCPKQIPSLTIMVGLPGSGKSTVAAAICDIDSSIALVSSDAIRKELYGDEGIQGSPEDVFKVVNQRIHALLSEGKSVLYDATNLYPKSRKSVLSAIPDGMEVQVKFWVINTPLDVCIRRNEGRERVVPEEVIRRMASRFTYPQKSEWPGSIVVTQNR